MKKFSTKLLVPIVTALAAALALCVFIALRYNDFWRFARETGLSLGEAVELYGKPTADSEWLASVSNAAADGDWDRLDRLTEKDRHSEIGSCYRNLAKAMKGELSENLMSYYAPFERALFIPVNENSNRLSIALSGEVWYRLGEMTMAEHSAILGLIFSKNQNGPRYLQRLGDINLIWGDLQAAKKYHDLTGKPSSLSEEELMRKRAQLPSEDHIHSASDYRSALKALVAADGSNRPAYEYLLCLDLLCKDLRAFIEDFNPEMPVTRLYQEAGLIWMASTGDHSSETASRFRVGEDVFNEFQQFTTMFGNAPFKDIQDKFGTTYWFYFKYAVRNEKND